MIKTMYFPPQRSAFMRVAKLPVLVTIHCTVSIVNIYYTAECNNRDAVIVRVIKKRNVTDSTRYYGNFKNTFSAYFLLPRTKCKTLLTVEAEEMQLLNSVL